MKENKPKLLGWNYSTDHLPTHQHNLPRDLNNLFRTQSDAIAACRRFCRGEGYGDEYDDSMVAPIYEKDEQ